MLSCYIWSAHILLPFWCGIKAYKAKAHEKLISRFLELKYWYFRAGCFVPSEYLWIKCIAKIYYVFNEVLSVVRIKRGGDEKGNSIYQIPTIALHISNMLCVVEGIYMAALNEYLSASHKSACQRYNVRIQSRAQWNQNTRHSAPRARARCVYWNGTIFYGYITLGATRSCR